MASSQSESGIPDGILVGGLISFVAGFIPLINFAGPFFGGATATYIEEYGILKSILAGFVVGLISLIPLAIYFAVGIIFTGGSAVLEMDILTGLGIFGGFFGGLYFLVTLFINPITGAIGGIFLGFYFHLIYKTNG